MGLFPVNDYCEIFDGLWGYNPLLTAAALSCVFFRCNARSCLLAAVGAAATFVVQFALRANMVLVSGIPVFTVPMVLTSLVLILASDEAGGLARVAEPSYPERQAGWLGGHRAVPTSEEKAEAEEEEGNGTNGSVKEEVSTLIRISMTRVYPESVNHVNWA